MPESERERRQAIEAIWLGKLREAEQRLYTATNQLKDVYSEHQSRTSADENPRLREALALQSQATDEYRRVLDVFTRLVIEGELPDQDTH